MSLEWRGEQAKFEIENATIEGIQRATEYYAEMLALEIGVSAKIGRGTKNRDYQASRPGEPPRQRKGKLKKWIMYEIDRDKLRARIGVNINALYGLFLEFGTRKMAARPWLVATFNKYIDAIRAQLMIGSGAK